MDYFHEIEPGIHLMADRQLAAEEDGQAWAGEFDMLLARGRPVAVIANVRNRPAPPAGKPMILWTKARKEELSRLVRLSVYIAEDRAEHDALEHALPVRMKSSPYPMAVAHDEAEAVAKARASLA
jgi:hypothetical protein